MVVKYCRRRSEVVLIVVSILKTSISSTRRWLSVPLCRATSSSAYHTTHSHRRFSLLPRSPHMYHSQAFPLSPSVASRKCTKEKTPLVRRWRWRSMGSWRWAILIVCATFFGAELVEG